VVWVSFGQRRPRGRRYGYGGHSRRGGGGCLRDLLLVETGCCLAEALGGPQLLLTPAAGRLLLSRSALDRPRAASLVRLYQREVSAKRARPCCRMTPSCSAYALDALAAHGTVRGLRLTAARLLRCRPGGPTGDDAVPPVTRAV
jgi:putative membrane protein insertion efficiency factor